MKGPRGAHSAGGRAGRGHEDGAGAVEAAQAGARPREGPPAGPTPFRQGEKRGLPGHHKSVQECSWPAGLWQGGDKGPASTTQVWAPGSRHRPPLRPVPCMPHYLSITQMEKVRPREGRGGRGVANPRTLPPQARGCPIPQELGTSVFLGPDDRLSQPGLIGGFKAPHSPACSVSRWPWGLHSPKLNLKPAICTAPLGKSPPQLCSLVISAGFPCLPAPGS